MPWRGQQVRAAARPWGNCIPTLYAGEIQSAALFETVFRDLPPLPLQRVVRESRALGGVSVAILSVTEPLRLAPLFGQRGIG